MELFTVTCTTCQCRLKVRERAVIGQILACPKCQAMVLVQPPPDWVDPGVGPAAVAVGSTGSVPTTSATTAPARPAGAPVIESNFDDAAQLLSKPARFTPAPTPAPATAPTAAAAPAAPPVAEVPAPPAALPVSARGQTRLWMMAGGISTAAVVGLIALLIYATSGNKQATDSPLADSGNNAPVVEPADNPEPQPETPGETPADPSPGEPADPAPAPPSEQPDKPAEVAVDPQPMPGASPDSKQPDPEQLANSDVPPDLAPPPGQAADPADNAAPKPLNTFNVDSALESLSPLIEDKPFGPPAETAADVPLPPPEPMPQPAPVVPDPREEEEPLPRPAPRAIDIPRRLADPLEGIELTDVALADFLQLVTELSTIPITLDPAALPAVKASPDSKLSITLQKSTVGELLTKALATKNLTFVPRDGGIVVLPTAAAQGQLRQIKHDVSDLVADAEQAETLAALIQTVVDPAGWKEAGGAGEIAVDGQTLLVTQTPTSHFGLMLLCEKLRLAKKLPPRTQFPAEVLTLAPRYDAVRPLLDQPITLNFFPPTRLAKVAQRIQATTGLRVLIDWQALGEQGWTPEAEVKIGAANQPLGEFLTRLSSRMGLGLRVLDNHTIQLTSADHLRQYPDVEVYVTPSASEDFAAKLRASLGDEWFAEDSGYALRFEPLTQTIVARLPQSEQKRLGELLAKP